MCYHPNKQTGNIQLASHDRIITPSFHLSSILMAERDKQSVNAPGVCVITHHMLAKAHTHMWCAPCLCTHTHTHRLGEKQSKLINLCCQHLSDYSSVRKSSRRESEKQKERQEKEGGSKQVGYELFLSIFHLPVSSGRWLI